MIHWKLFFRGNIPGSNVNQGNELCSYLQPFPPRGIGYCRYIFVLFKQEKKLDFSKHAKQAPCFNLEDRDFSTFDFYKEYQDEMTPIGLSFFQADWDSSLTDFYHNVLGKLRKSLIPFHARCSLPLTLT